mgnify:CR=1 FL=1
MLLTFLIVVVSLHSLVQLASAKQQPQSQRKNQLKSNMSDILKDFAVKALNLTDEQIAEIVYSDDKGTIKETAAEELLRLNAERVSELKAAKKGQPNSVTTC